jgi:predicted helicase
MSDPAKRKARIYYARVDEFWRKEEKYAYLAEKEHLGHVEWQEIKPDAKHNWLTEGMHAGFEELLALATKESKASEARDQPVIFKSYGRGIATTRDVWAYNFDESVLTSNVRRTIETYNEQVSKWTRARSDEKKLDDFVTDDATKISWSEGLKHFLKRGISTSFDSQRIRHSLYRPFTRNCLYFDTQLNERRYQWPSISPNPQTSIENATICLSDRGLRSPFSVLATNLIADLHLCATSDLFQCFPFYTYNEDGTNRRENITDWALEQFRSNYKDKSITKWDIFYYVYAVLHHPLYRERYAANLKRELPRIPFAPDLRGFSEIGKSLAEIHVNYEQQPEYPLERIETPGVPLDWRVEKMKLSKDKRSIIYNDFLTLSGIPPEVVEYRLGNRSALDWIIDQYKVSTDKRSGITNDPNRADDPQYIVRLIGQVITASLETVQLVSRLNELSIVETASS